MEIIILLTGCINPNGMNYTFLTDVNERKEQYIKAIQFYLKETSCKIVFCENSNTDLKSLFKDYQDRLECITFSGNQEKQRGKGYGEAEIIEYAIKNSLWLRNECIIIKITGRLLVNNITRLLKSFNHKKKFVTCLIRSSLVFADSRIICASKSFYIYFLSLRNRINDNEGMYFEHVLCEAIIHSPIRYIPFCIEPQVTGISGSTGELYRTKILKSTDIYQYKCYSLKQLITINKKANFRDLNYWGIIRTSFSLLWYKFLFKIHLEYYKIRIKQKWF